jgi:predicted nucleic acid-binding protein
MKYLLDVNVLLAAIWANHSRHAETFAWLDGKTIVLCPLGELGFLRISPTKRPSTRRWTKPARCSSDLPPSGRPSASPTICPRLIHGRQRRNK